MVKSIVIFEEDCEFFLDMGIFLEANIVEGKSPCRQVDILKEIDS
jgi:hypothetical protein